MLNEGLAHTLTAIAVAARDVSDADAGGGLGQGVALMIVGMGVVLLSLVVIGLVILVLGYERKQAPPAAVTPEPVAEEHTGIPPHHVVVITAAVAAVAGSRARLTKVVMLGQTRDWVAKGRSGVMGSHRPLRPR